ncbi:MAG: hypothetical protein KGO52_16415 [Nitrospirota bacterium]|nr:hypothetical protein [Nitrospirota bacterium]
MIIQRAYPLRATIPLIAALVLCILLFGLTGEAGAKEFRFVAQELGKGQGAIEMGEMEIWLPTAVVIDQEEDLKEPVWFVLENPTGTDHEFAVVGLFMYLSVEEMAHALGIDPHNIQPHMLGPQAETIMEPIRVKIKAGETKKILVAPVGLAGKRNLGAHYQFFCPKHKDIRVSGFIFVD